MKEHSTLFSIKKMAKILMISRSGYYHFFHRKCSKRYLENEELIKEIKQIFKESRQTYGSPRIYSALINKGKKYSRKRRMALFISYFRFIF